MVGDEVGGYWAGSLRDYEDDGYELFEWTRGELAGH